MAVEEAGRAALRAVVERVLAVLVALRAPGAL
jgi:hypothetical protein